MAKIKGAIVVDTERCKGCNLCVVACPLNVIALTKEVNVKGYNYAHQILEDTCWEQLEFEFANHMPAYIDTIGEMLDIMERGQVYKKYAHQTSYRRFSIKATV